MIHEGPASPPRVPERLCVACRTLVPRTVLLRLVRTPDGEVVLDLDHRQQGRGAYVCRNATCVAQATRRNAFSRALRRPVPEVLIDQLAEAAGTPGT